MVRGSGDPLWEPVVRLPFARSSAGAARHHLSAFLDAALLTPPLSHDAVIVLGELVANALDHGLPDDRGDLEIGFALDARSLWVTVHDGGGATVPQVRRATRFAERGRGLAMVQALSSWWSYEQSDGTRVTARLDRPGGGS